MSYSEEQLREAFSKFDADGSGEISARELVDAILALRPQDDRTTCLAIAHGILKNTDKDDDGKITFAEFQAEMSKN
jgi:Ca2+-binding EF-hand superfamily protein